MAERQAARTVALAWGLAAAPQRGPKRELSLERIVEAAIAIADAEGLAAVTMQRVAQSFDFTTMALYRYVATKDELHQLMLDAAFGDTIRPVAAPDWRAGLDGFIRALLEGYRSHPWALDIPLEAHVHLMPGQLRAADSALRAMRSLEVPAETKLALLIVLSSFVRGFAAVAREVLSEEEPEEATRELLREAVTPGEFPDIAPLVRDGRYFGEAPDGAPAAAPESAGDDAEILLDFAIGVLLGGVDAMAAAQDGAEGVADVPNGPPRTPQEDYEAAEAELRAHIELRKATQRRVRELERRENALRRVRDKAKEIAKASR